MKRVVVATHVALVDGKEYDGIGNSLMETFKELDADFTFVKHSIDGNMRSAVYDVSPGASQLRTKLWSIRRLAPLRYVSEVLSTLAYFTFTKKVDVYIGVDPLNACAGVILKRLGRVEYVVFYTADYTKKRFSSSFLNNIYHSIDAFCVKRSDEVWSVSQRIREVRRDMGLDESRNIFVPNVPPGTFNALRNNRHKKYELITSGIIDKQLDNEGSIRAVSILQEQYPELSLTIIGNGPEEEGLHALARQLGIDKKIRFTGRLSLAETLERTSRAGIGLALYTGTWSFNEYGDSTKCREFFSYGLPVISTDTHSTVSEIQDAKAGLIVGMSTDEYVIAIKKIFSQYDSYSDNSRNLGLKYEGVHSKHIRRIIK